MESEEKMERRNLTIDAAREAESMTASVRIIKEFNLAARRVESEQADREIHFQEVWPYLTQTRWEELCHLVFREDRYRNKAALIEKCKSEPLLDAAFELVNHNTTFRYAPSDEFYIDPSELFASLSPSHVKEALSRSSRMLSHADNVVLALLHYPQATRTYQEEFERFTRDNPGFSEESYKLAVSRKMVGM